MLTPTAEVINGVITWVPQECSVNAYDANLADANAFQPTHMDYYVDQIPSMVPGFVLGGISLVGFVLMLCWICVRCCRRRKLAKADKEETEQFLTSSEGGMASSPPLPRLGRRQRYSDILTFLVALLALGAMGCALWGMGKSIQATNHVIVDFWDIVYDVQDLVDDAADIMTDMSANLNVTAAAIETLSSQAGVVASALEQVGITPANASEFVSTISAVPLNVITNISATIMTTAVPILRKDIMSAVLNVLDFESPTMSIQTTWRFVVFAVLFGLLVLFIILSGLTVFWMRFGRWASLMIALTWLLNAIVCIGGTGLLRGVQSVSEDACLYTETFIYNDIVTTIGSASTQSAIKKGVDYYFGLINITEVAESKANDLANSSLVQSDIVQFVLNRNDTQFDASLSSFFELAQRLNATLHTALSNFGDQAGSRLLALGVPNATVTALVDLSGGVGGTLGSTERLVRRLLRINVSPIYYNFKFYLCCILYDVVYSVWLPWTITGCLVIAFCLLASLRIIWQTIYPADKGWVGLWGYTTRKKLMVPEAAGSAGPAGAASQQQLQLAGSKEALGLSGLSPENALGGSPGDHYYYKEPGGISGASSPKHAYHEGQRLSEDGDQKFYVRKLEEDGEGEGQGGGSKGQPPAGAPLI